MKSILISIQPQWVEKILNGEKTIEIRKTMPKCELPCRVYIYCTKGKDKLRRIPCYHIGEPNKETSSYKIINLDYNTNEVVNGKVVAEFTLNKLERWRPKGMVYGSELVYIVGIVKKTCLTMPQLIDYADTNKELKEHCFAWFISNLKIYDVPKELSEFVSDKALSYDDWLFGIYSGHRGSRCNYNSYLNAFRLKRPPQSWCYISEEI